MFVVAALPARMRYSSVTVRETVPNLPITRLRLEQIDVENVDLASLSDAAAETLRTIGFALQAGYRQSEIAEELGVSRHTVRRRVERAKNEIRRNATRVDRPCANCGAPIPAVARPNRLTCSSRCRVALHRFRKR